MDQNEQIAQEIVDDAIRWRRMCDEERFHQCAAVLAAPYGLPGMPEPARWARTVDRVLLSALCRVVTAAWHDGWQPADVVRRMRRVYGDAHVRLTLDVIAAEMRAYAVATVDERWLAQMAELGARVWWDADEEILRADGDRQTTVVHALHLVYELTWRSTLPRLWPPPGTARPGAVPTSGRAGDERTLARIRALLAKAESTDFPAEAETFTSAAQSLMARHSIDAAMLADSAGSGGGDEPCGRRVGIDTPYESAKANLLAEVAVANRCRAVWSKGLGFSTVFGFDSDLDAVELLFTSLLVQATSAMVKEGARRDRSGTSRTRSFRQSFLLAYAQRIGERLSAASGQAVRQAVEETGRDLLPVLAAREQAVDEAVHAMFPRLVRGGSRPVANLDGWVSGRAAADLALLNARRRIT
ncbi:hypothetical protein Pth03_09240 [Planotetraspora thailandica]|uniref:DUF2786 domain-containing protein n=1 Tax=Planotetraspora thailandica TaxID=487172 RepID=A0A8J3XTW7_9ACTN|nr:DUF2786 domain-containing protein [Planotetraspora thailandica]GII52535.1 hypothetical protein Pth03_09240 [Planotetraspora thailandica]